MLKARRTEPLGVRKKWESIAFLAKLSLTHRHDNDRAKEDGFHHVRPPVHSNRQQFAGSSSKDFPEHLLPDIFQLEMPDMGLQPPRCLPSTCAATELQVTSLALKLPYVQSTLWPPRSIECLLRLEEAL